MSYEQELVFAKELAAQAGAIIKEEFYKSQVVTMKSDNSPVTAIDEKINELVSNAVRQSFAADGFDGEEGTSGELSSERIWVCDPIDGTISFLLHEPASMFMLGLFVNGIGQLAVSYNPITDELYEARKGQGALKNGEIIRASQQSVSDRPFIAIEGKVYRESPQVVERLETLGYQVHALNGTGTKVMKVAEGLSAGMFRNGGDYHDVGVGAIIAEEAGAIVTSLRGQNMLDANLRIHDGFIIANPKASADIREIIDSL